MAMAGALRFVQQPVVVGVSMVSLGAAAYVRFGGGPKEAVEARSLRKETLVVTGADSGIGKATTKLLLQRKARVIMACRDMDLCTKVRRELVKETNSKRVGCRHLDLASLASVKEFVRTMREEERELTGLVTNAAIMAPQHRLSQEGLELHLAVNHVNQALLTQLLTPLLEPNAGRVLHVSCTMAKSALATLDPEDLNAEKLWQDGGLTRDTRAYAHSKLLAQIWALNYARELEGQGSSVTLNVVDPGPVRSGLERYQKWANTNWTKHFWRALRWFTHEKEEAAAKRIVHLVTAKKLTGLNGKFYERLEEAEPSKEALDVGLGAWVSSATSVWSRAAAVEAALASPSVPLRDLIAASDSRPHSSSASSPGWGHWLLSSLHLR